MTMTKTSDLLTDDMLARFDERAPVYDQENRFFDEDFEELRASGFLTRKLFRHMSSFMDTTHFSSSPARTRS